MGSKTFYNEYWAGQGEDYNNFSDRAGKIVKSLYDCIKYPPREVFPLLVSYVTTVAEHHAGRKCGYEPMFRDCWKLIREYNLAGYSSYELLGEMVLLLTNECSERVLRHAMSKRKEHYHDDEVCGLAVISSQRQM